MTRRTVLPSSNIDVRPAGGDQKFPSDKAGPENRRIIFLPAAIPLLDRNRLSPIFTCEKSNKITPVAILRKSTLFCILFLVSKQEALFASARRFGSLNRVREGKRQRF